jgi:polyprenyl P-hydroxybenzoate/phenylacrylic acid decarboxylase-like protein
MTRGAEITSAHETDYTSGRVMKLADIVHEIDDIGDSIASGSFRTEGMIILPCSMKTAAGIACGYSDNLLLRAADVTLKEHRTLVIAARENPLSTIHLRNLLTLSEAGAYIMPPVISCYNKPESLEDMNLQILGKLLDRFGIETEGYRRWE